MALSKTNIYLLFKFMVPFAIKGRELSSIIRLSFAVAIRSVSLHSLKVSPEHNVAHEIKYISTYRFVLILALMYAVSIGTAAARSAGRLIVSRDPNLGRKLVVNLLIDNRTAANLARGSRFDRLVRTGPRVLSVSASQTPLGRRRRC